MADGLPAALDPMCAYCEIRLSEHEEITPWCEEEDGWGGYALRPSVVRGLLVQPVEFEPVIGQPQPGGPPGLRERD